MMDIFTRLALAAVGSPSTLQPATLPLFASWASADPTESRSGAGALSEQTSASEASQARVTAPGRQWPSEQPSSSKVNLREMPQPDASPVPTFTKASTSTDPMGTIEQCVATTSGPHMDANLARDHKPFPRTRVATFERLTKELDSLESHVSTDGTVRSSGDATAHRIDQSPSNVAATRPASDSKDISAIRPVATSSASPMASRGQPDAPSVIRISIGAIEVRSSARQDRAATAPAGMAQTRARRKPSLTLDDYLGQFNRSRR